jgi:hypothetical protein
MVACCLLLLPAQAKRVEHLLPLLVPLLPQIRNLLTMLLRVWPQIKARWKKEKPYKP